jgi:hypothetical protein
VTQVATITGQERLTRDINRLLASDVRPAVWLRGPSGSGKTWVAQAILESWRKTGNTGFVAPGDELFGQRPRFPLLLAVSAETGRAQSKAATRLALDVSAIDVVHSGGSGNNGGYHTCPLSLEDPPNESSS